MKELFAFIEKHSFILLFFVLQIISFILIVNFNEPQKSQYGAVSTAFQGKLHSVTHKITQYFYLEFANRRLVEENAKLYENQEFSQYDNAVNSSVVEDTEYEQQYEYIPAKVLNNSINKIQNFIVINKGWKQGIQKNMAVICPTGIVGVVVRTSQHYSLIMTVLNTNFKVSTRFKNSGRKVRRRSFSTKERMSRSDFPSGAFCTEKPSGDLVSVMVFAPILEVMTITVFRKSTFLPSESVRQPSSITCKNKLKTSSCAFSISSNKITE